MNRDQNLLFGILAAQLRRVPALEVIHLTKAWETDPTRNLPDRMVEAGALSDQERNMLLGLLDGARDDSPENGNHTLDPAHHRGEQTAQAGLEYLPETLLDSRNSTRSDAPRAPRGLPEFPGRYSTNAEFARGGMGRILLVNDDLLAREVALKELLPCHRGPLAYPGEPWASPHAERFIQEARITGRLEHPSIVPVYELGYRQDGAPYYTMRVVRGRTLSQAIGEAACLADRLKLLPHFLDLCHAMAYAHSRGVIHRDIKPANVMLGEFGETVVIDWGLAKARDREDIHAESLAHSAENIRHTSSNPSRTSGGSILGTPIYMPPEQALGWIEAIDERSDVYTLGAVLYELLSGRPPFTGRSAQEVIDKVVHTTCPDLLTLEPRTPPELAAIGARAMQKDPARRYQSAKELADEVERFLSGALVQSYDYRFYEHLKRFVARRKAILLTAAAALVVLAASVLFYNVQLVASRDLAERNGRQAVVAKEHSDREFYYASIALAQRSINESHFTQARRLLAGCPPLYRNWEWSRLRRLCSLDARTFVGHMGPINAVAFDPRGALIATATDDARLPLWDRTHPNPVSMLSGFESKMMCVAFSPTGDRIGAGGADGTARIWSRDTGTLLYTLQGHTKTVAAIAFSPDGALVATGSDDDSVCLWSAVTGQLQQTLLGHLNGVTSLAFSPRGDLLATGSLDNTARVWELSTGQTRTTYREHSNDVTAVAFSPDGALLASVGLNGNARVWDPSSGTTRYTHTDTSALNCVAFSPNGQSIALGDRRNGVLLWDYRNESTRPLLGHDGSVRSVAFSPDGATLLSGSEDGTAKLWNLEQEHAQYALQIHPKGNYRVRLAPSTDGTRVVAADNNGNVVLWDLRTDQRLSEFRPDTFDAMEPGSGMNRLLTLRANGAVNVWELAAGAKTLSMNDPLLTAVTLNQGEDLLGIGSRDGSVKVVSIEDGRSSTFQEHTQAVIALAFSPNRAYLATGSEDGTICVWDLAAVAVRHTLHPAHTPLAMAFSPDSAFLVAAGAGLSVWDMNSGQEVLSATNDTSPKTCLAVSPDGKRLATGGLDGKVTLWAWDTDGVRALLNLTASAGPVESVAFSPDGAALVALGEGRRASDTFVRWVVTDWRHPESAATPLNRANSLADATALSAKNLRAHLDALSAQMTPPVLSSTSTDRALTQPQFRQMLQMAADILKANRDEKQYRGKPFVSGGLLMDDPRMSAFTLLGFEVGDIITHINGIAVTSYDAAIEALRATELGATALLHVELLRNDLPIALDFHLDPSSADTSTAVAPSS